MHTARLILLFARLERMPVLSFVFFVGSAPLASVALFQKVALADTLIVNSTADPGDGVCDDAECTLREAIEAANGNPGPDCIAFAIAGPGPHTIQPLSDLPGITDPVTIDGYTQPGASPNTLGIGPDSPGHALGDGTNAVLLIELDGSNLGDYSVGLHLLAGSSTVRGLVINHFRGIAIWIDGGTGGTGGNTIAGNFIGTDASGTVARGNAAGPRVLYNQFEAAVTITSSPHNTIGGLTPADRNLISGNHAEGIDISDSYDLGIPLPGNVVQGNLIGTDATGTGALGNASDGISIGWNMGGFPFKQVAVTTFVVQIGGTTPAARNVISANRGVRYLGQNGSTGSGIYTGGTHGLLVQGNFIGTDVTGTRPLGNAVNGVVITFSSNLTIGGTAVGAGNLISGNGGYGGLAVGEATQIRVQGNYIGTDVTGTVALSGQSAGMILFGASWTAAPEVVIGGPEPGAGNLISGNGAGIDIRERGMIVQGNLIGTDKTGTFPVPNGHQGIYLADSASYNRIGGTDPGEGNVIVGAGIVFNTGPAVRENVVQGNSISRASFGVAFAGDTFNNLIGGTDPGAGNTITDCYVGIVGNRYYLAGPGMGNSVRGNSIYNNTGMGIDWVADPGGQGSVFDGVTPNDRGDGDTGPNGLQNFPVLSAAFRLLAGTLVNGVLDSTPGTTFTVELFANASCDTSGFGEGEVFLGSTTVTTDSTGIGSFELVLAALVPGGHFITATATDSENNTSEFSECLVVQTIPELLSAVIDYVTSLELDKGTKTELLKSLEAALRAVNAGNAAAAVGQLQAFLQQLRAATPKRISETDSQRLIEAVEEILQLLRLHGEEEE